jgi:Zn-dependent M28 family amino/carboxypeptidase
MIWMPGRSFHGIPALLDEAESRLRESLQQDLKRLGQEIGERNLSQRYPQLIEAAKFIEQALQNAGYEVRRQEITVHGKVVWNIDAQCTGHACPQEIIVVGAHYDTVPGSPGANDNGSAVVANLELARAFAGKMRKRTVRFAFFVNEEMPYYMTDSMGSLRYAQQCRENGENVVGMIALETIGCYLDEPLTQRYPIGSLRHLYPTTGNFIAVVGNLRSRPLVHRVIRGLRRTQFPSEGMAAPTWLKDIFRSDHAAFWCCGYPALMITDTANFRYPYYHTSEDTIDKINYAALARVVTGLNECLASLAG